MIPITNEKLSGLEPSWAPFAGFSLLFDNPGPSLSTAGAAITLETDVGQEPEHRLYQTLRDGLERLGHDDLLQSYLLCLLPTTSYHVTVWDGINVGNLSHVAAEHRGLCQRFLDELPHSLGQPHLFPEISASPLLRKTDWNVRFRFERAEIWSNVSLVASLAPTDGASQQTLERIREAREVLSAAFAQRWGVSPCATYVPHITLGYFANPQLLQQKPPPLESWNAAFREIAAEQTLTFSQIGLYGFRDMATFFRAVPA